MDRPKLSVVVPTQANGRGLGRALRTVQDQIGVDVRIIVVVDGTPTCEADRLVLAELGSSHKVIAVSRLGHPGAVRNIGLGLVQTPYVAFLDDDDAWVPQKSARQLRLLGEGSVSLVGTNAIRVAAGENVGPYFHSVPASLTLEDLMKSNWLITSSVIVDTQLLRSVGGFPTGDRYRAIEDYAAWLKVVACRDFTVLDEPLVQYTVGTDSISATHGLTGAEARARALKHLTETQAHWKRRLSRRQRALAQQMISEATE